MTEGKEMEERGKGRNEKGRGLEVPQRQLPGYVYACMQDRLDHTGLPSHRH